MCRKAYGYEPSYGTIFPEYRLRDYGAAKRIIIDIYKEIEERDELRKIKEEILE